METRFKTGFHLPHEHGAWWTFFSCLAAGLIQALAWKADPATSFMLAAGMACFFLASDWITELAHSLFERRLRPRMELGLKTGASIILTGCLLILLSLLRAESRLHGLGLGIASGLAAWAFAILIVLILRLKLPARSLGLLLPSAVLLTAPVMLLGALAFGGLGLKALGFWALWAWFFGAGIYYVQTWLRSYMLPRWRMVLASLPYLSQAAVLGWFSRWPGTLLLTLFSLRLLWRLKERVLDWDAHMAELSGGPAPSRLPTDGAEIRRLGWEQVAWSLVLGAVWTWLYWP